MDTKLALDEIKLNFQTFSKRISKLILYLVSVATVIMIFITLFSFGVFGGIDPELVIFYVPDLYTLFAILGTLFLSDLAGLKVLAAIIIICYLAYLTFAILIVSNIYEISKNFLSLSKVDVYLKDAKKAHFGLNTFIILTLTSTVIPSFGWIIVSFLSAVSLFLTFLVFHNLLKQYGLRMQIIKDTSFFIGLSAFFQILGISLVLVNLSFILLTIVSYIFFYFGVKRFAKQVEYIIPIVREAPPPPTIAAPVGPAPRPVLESVTPADTEDIPSPGDHL